MNAKLSGAIGGHGSGWSVGAESDPVAVVLSWKIILEAIPLFLWLIEPAHVPDPLQIIGVLGAHQIDNMPVGRDVARWSFACPSVPFAVPAKPVSVRLRPPFDQNGRREALSILRPGSKIDVEGPCNYFLNEKIFSECPWSTLDRSIKRTYGIFFRSRIQLHIATGNLRDSNQLSEK